MNKLPRWIDLLAFAIALGLLFAAAVAHAADYSGYTGLQLYQRFCAACHGARGTGDGPVSKTLKIAAPDLTRLAQRNGGRFPEDLVRQVIDGRHAVGSHGERDMPVWGYEFTAEEPGRSGGDAAIAQLVTRLTEQLRSMQK